MGGPDGVGSAGVPAMNLTIECLSEQRLREESSAPQGVATRRTFGPSTRVHRHRPRRAPPTALGTAVVEGASETFREALQFTERSRSASRTGPGGTAARRRARSRGPAPSRRPEPYGAVVPVCGVPGAGRIAPLRATAHRAIRDTPCAVPCGPPCCAVRRTVRRAVRRRLRQARNSPSLATTTPPWTTRSRCGMSTTTWGSPWPRTRTKSAGEPGVRSACGRPMTSAPPWAAAR